MSATAERAARGSVIGAAAMMLLSFALDWSRAGGESGDNPFHYPLTGGVAWLVVLGAGLLTLAGDRAPIPRSRRIAAVLALSGLALTTARVIAGGRSIEVRADVTVEVGRGPGMWLAAAAALVAAAGTVALVVAPVASRDEGDPAADDALLDHVEPEAREHDGPPPES